MPKKWDSKTGAVFAKRICQIELKKLVDTLGREHYVEADPTRTASGIERYWIFEISPDLALAFHYSDCKQELLIGENRQGEIHPKILERFFPYPTKKTQGLMWE